MTKADPPNSIPIAVWRAITDYKRAAVRFFSFGDKPECYVRGEDTFPESKPVAPGALSAAAVTVEPLPEHEKVIEETHNTSSSIEQTKERYEGVISIKIRDEAIAYFAKEYTEGRGEKQDVMLTHEQQFISDRGGPKVSNSTLIEHIDRPAKARGGVLPKRRPRRQ
jgi:hypothetical protein